MNRISNRAAGLAIGVAGLCLVTLAGGTIGLAQTPDVESAPARPIHIHEGSCDNLDPAPFVVLNDLLAPTGEAQYGGEGAPLAVQTGSTLVDVPLAELVAGQYAINVHESADQIENYIACGDIGGVLIPGADGTGDSLAIGLRELNDSGQAGIALLRADGEQTAVAVYLAASTGASGEASATGATHVDHAVSAAAAATVNIQDFLYEPDPITVAVGDSVTWTNLDTVAHTATALDRDVLQTKVLDQGESFTTEFAATGTFEYFCEFHPQMTGTVIVE